jgi:biotin--protein ligase
MNVLVYAGPGTSQSALKHTLSSLRSLLLPNYSIQTVLPEALSSDVWCSSCALLVLPGGRDALYLTSLESANKHIKKYVNSGGKYLGICAGAYYASANIEWEVGRPGMEVTGPRPLRFFPGLSKGCVYPGFEYTSESGARSATVLSGDHEYHGLYYNGGGEFVNAAQHETVKVLASYKDGEDTSMAAGVICFDGKGIAALWGVHLEYSLFQDPLNALLVAAGVSEQQKSEWEKDRIQLLRSTLSNLGLTLPAQDRRDYSRPHPQYFVCSPELGNTPSSISHDILTHNRTTSAHVLPDENDTFHFHEQDIDLRSKLETQYGPPSSSLEIELRGPKHIILCDSKPPTIQETPYFHIPSFFDFLKKARWKLSLPYPSPKGWGIGSLLLYSEAVTSTQTLLDK